MSFIVYWIVINIIGFIICLLDKIFAIKGIYRIREDILLLVALLGGCFGFLLSMHLFHHKTKKFKFKLIYLFNVLWIYFIFK